MSGHDGVLVETKLHAPRRRQGLVRRSRLEERLATAAVPPVVLVSAPAGFGKTTLLAQWAAEADDPGLRLAWVALDRRDSDPVVFWSYVIAALRKIDGELGTAALDLLQSSPAGLDTVVGALVNDLADHDRIVVVLDDYHVIDSVEVHESMGFLLEHLPPQVHVVVATRADPPWPLASLRARGDLLEIRAADLRFTPAETTAYLNDSAGLDLAADDIDVLEARTEGWIAALQLAAISLRGRDDRAAFIAAFAGDDRFVVDYLADEVLDRQPADIRSFLLQTSILGRLNAELCAAVTERRDANSMLNSLERSNMFLVALDDRRRWFRYHHLFADVLRARLADERGDTIPELHRRAAAWYEAHSDDAEAIAHAVAGGDFGRAARLIELAAPELRKRRQEKTLRSWLEALPAATFTDRPVLAISLVGARMATGDTTGVESLLDAVEAALGSSTTPTVLDEHEFAGLPAQVLVYRAALALLAGDIEATIAHATAALDLVASADDLRRGSASALLALAQWTNGELDTAEDRYTDAVAALIDADHIPDALGCSLALADVQIARGRLTDATKTLATGLRSTAAQPGLRGAADLHVGLSEVLIERNELDAAAHHLQTSAELGDSAGLPQHAYRWRVTMARLCRARGDLEAGLALVDEAVPLYDTDFSPPVRPVAAIRARMRLARGELAAATAWISDRRISATDELSYVHEYEHITLARILIARHAAGDGADLLADAIQLLDRLLIAAEQGGRTGSTIEIRILQAAAQYRQGNTPAALDALDDALRRAEPEGHVRLFLHAGPEVTTLLRGLATRRRVTPHTTRVLAALPTSDVPASSASSPALVDQLSPRELDVLRLLRTELTGPEIAGELVVSLNTVRTHTKNIFTKLGATNRRAAVRRADELGL